MGYESKIYVVQESASGLFGEDGLVYGSVIATFNLCKMGYETYYGKCFHDLFDQERTCYIYADDGNTIIEEDCYGDPLKKADNSEVIMWLKAFQSNEQYWRAAALLSCLEALERTGESYSIYHYGY